MTTSYYCSVADDGRIISHSACHGQGMMQPGPPNTLTREITEQQYRDLSHALGNGTNAYWDDGFDQPVLAAEWQVDGLPESGVELIPGNTLTLTWEKPTYVQLEINGELNSDRSPLEIEVPASGRLKLEVTDPRLARVKRSWNIAEAV